MNEKLSNFGPSVIICSFGEAQYIRLTINALEKQTLMPSEILIVDNNPVIRNWDDLKNISTIKIVHCKKRGLSVARNFGINIATGKIITFLDDDSVPDTNWLKYMVEGLETYKADMAGGRVDLSFSDNGWWLSRNTRAYLSELIYKGCDIPDVVPPRYVVGANMAFKADAFARFGFFTDKSGRDGTKLISSEDVEMVRRIYYRGGKVSFLSQAKVVHLIPKKRTTVSYLIKRAFWQGISDCLLEQLQPLQVKKKRKLSVLDFAIILEFMRMLGKIYYKAGLYNHG